MSQYTYFENIKPTVIQKCLSLVFLSSTLYVLCIETKINFVNQNKGKITLIILPWGRLSLAVTDVLVHFNLKQ